LRERQKTKQIKLDFLYGIAKIPANILFLFPFLPLAHRGVEMPAGRDCEVAVRPVPKRCSARMQTRHLLDSLVL
jgi:hypothetical protein